MVKLNEKLRAKYVIKTFLCAHRGKKFTARQICAFIVENKLCSKNSELHQNAVARMIQSDKRYGTILRDVQVEKVRGRNFYYMESL